MNTVEGGLRARAWSLRGVIARYGGVLALCGSWACSDSSDVDPKRTQPSAAQDAGVGDDDLHMVEPGATPRAADAGAVEPAGGEAPQAGGDSHASESQSHMSAAGAAAPATMDAGVHAHGSMHDAATDVEPSRDAGAPPAHAMDSGETHAPAAGSGSPSSTSVDASHAAASGTHASPLQDAAPSDAGVSPHDGIDAAAPHPTQDSGPSDAGAPPHEEMDAAAPHPHDAGPADSGPVMQDAATSDSGSHEHDAGDAGEHGPHMRCPMKLERDPRDDTAATSPTTVRVGFSRDVVLPQALVEWMTEHELEQAHIGWHETRLWDQQCQQSLAPATGCDFAQALLVDELWRADMQQGAPGAGLAFLAMHRHMIMQLTAAFPKHLEMLSGFTHVPRTRTDAENPTPWKAPTWSQDNLQGFDILEHIEEHLDMFPSDDDLGRYIESNFVWTAQAPAQASGQPGAGTHAALHNEWSVAGSSADLGRFDTALHNYTFWKLHGFIDEVWERYRAAKGLGDQDPAYLQALDDECYGMYLLQPSHRALFVPND